MSRKLISLIVCFVLSMFSLNAIKVEVIQDNLGFIADTDTKTASLWRIYATKDEKLSIAVPKYVEWDNQQYLVTSICQYVFKDFYNQIYHVTLPDSIENTLETRKACCFLMINSHIPKDDKYEISKLFEVGCDYNNAPLFKKLNEGK